MTTTLEIWRIVMASVAGPSRAVIAVAMAEDSVAAVQLVGVLPEAEGCEAFDWRLFGHALASHKQAKIISVRTACEFD